MSIVQTISSVLFANRRFISGILPDVVIEEQHNDQLIISDHPIETGSSITDHAYMMPSEVTMRVGWSESAGALNELVGNSIFGGAKSLSAIYDALLLLQSSAQPIIISTGKRLYRNMLIKSLGVTTDATSEHALMVNITFRSIKIVKSRETTIQAENQANPAKTAGVVNGGARATAPVDQTQQSRLDTMISVASSKVSSAISGLIS